MAACRPLPLATAHDAVTSGRGGKGNGDGAVGQRPTRKVIDMTTRRVVLAAALLAACAMTVPAQVEFVGPPEKRLLEYGWDVPRPSFVADHIGEMEERPFDGLLMLVPEIGQIFVPVKHEIPPAEEAALERIEWGSFTDNFLMMYAASQMDWFSDSDWEAVLYNVGQVARAARIGRCVGVCFDCEPYGDNPWHYPSQPHADEYSFAEFEARVRERGAQFVDTIEAEMAAPVIHTFFLTTLHGIMNAARAETAEEREEILRDYSYGLYNAFVNGMLDAMDEDTVLTDGNEPAYYYHDKDAYFSVYHYIRQTALGAIAPENWQTFRGQVQVAQALYVDQLFGLRAGVFESHYMTPEERAQWFEHNTYWALYTSDRYVWLYSEKMNWWTDTDVPPGLEQAVINARSKLAAGEPMTIDANEIFQAAHERMQAEIQEQLEHRTAQVTRIAPLLAPTINGWRDDPTWHYATELEPLMARFASGDEEIATTLAHVTCDDRALYVAIRCNEPQMDELEVVGSRRDDDVWLGDSIDLFVQREMGAPYYHVIVNPWNVVWDAVHTDVAGDTSWDPDLQTGTLMGDGFWNVEIALPWAAMGWDPPERGDTLRANICRQRRPVAELSAWSQTVTGFVEPGSFGTWEF